MFVVGLSQKLRAQAYDASMAYIIIMGIWERWPFKNVSVGQNPLKSGSVYSNVPTLDPNCSHTGVTVIVYILPALQLEIYMLWAI